MGKVDEIVKLVKMKMYHYISVFQSQIGWDDKDARNCDNSNCLMSLIKNSNINPTIVNRKKLNVFYSAGVKHKKFEMVNYLPEIQMYLKNSIPTYHLMYKKKCFLFVCQKYNHFGINLKHDV